jgi:hypothetical protein
MSAQQWQQCQHNNADGIIPMMAMPVQRGWQCKATMAKVPLQQRQQCQYNNSKMPVQ